MSKTRENIIRLANDFILKYKIDALPLHIDDFQKLCDTLGYDLLSFSGAAALAFVLRRSGARKSHES